MVLRIVVFCAILFMICQAGKHGARSDRTDRQRAGRPCHQCVSDTAGHERRHENVGGHRFAERLCPLPFSRDGKGGSGHAHDSNCSVTGKEAAAFGPPPLSIHILFTPAESWNRHRGIFQSNSATPLRRSVKVENADVLFSLKAYASSLSASLPFLPHR